jgi:hypothetical protein
MLCRFAERVNHALVARDGKGRARPTAGQQRPLSAEVKSPAACRRVSVARGGDHRHRSSSRPPCRADLRALPRPGSVTPGDHAGSGPAAASRCHPAWWQPSGNGKAAARPARAVPPAAGWCGESPARVRRPIPPRRRLGVPTAYEDRLVVADVLATAIKRTCSASRRRPLARRQPGYSQRCSCHDLYMGQPIVTRVTMDCTLVAGPCQETGSLRPQPAEGWPAGYAM